MKQPEVTTISNRPEETVRAPSGLSPPISMREVSTYTTVCVIQIARVIEKPDAEGAEL